MASRTWLISVLLVVVYLSEPGAGTAATRQGSVCHLGVCYTLFLFDDPGGSTWSDAFYSCQDQGLRLTSVVDEATQHQLERVPNVDWGESGSTWIAGRQSDSPAWIWANNVPYTGDDLPSDTHNKCGALQHGGLIAAECTAMKRSICQKPNDGGCASGWTVWLDSCVWLAGSSETWFGSKVQCASLGADLVSIPSEALSLLEALAVASGDFWIGVRQHIWTWAISTGQGTVYRPMEYFHFDNEEGAHEYDHCVAMDKNYAWDDRRCLDTWTQFFCDDGTLVPGEPSVPLVTNPGNRVTPGPGGTVSPTEAAGSAGNNPSERVTPGAGVGTMTIVYALVGVIIAILIIVVVSVLVLRARLVRHPPPTSPSEGAASTDDVPRNDRHVDDAVQLPAQTEIHATPDVLVRYPPESSQDTRMIRELRGAVQWRLNSNYIGLSGRLDSLRSSSVQYEDTD